MNGVKIFYGLIIVLLLSFLVYAAEQKIFTNANYLGNNIYNVTNVTAVRFIGNGSLLTGISTGGDNASWNVTTASGIFATFASVTGNITLENTTMKAYVQANFYNNSAPINTTYASVYNITYKCPNGSLCWRTYVNASGYLITENG